MEDRFHRSLFPLSAFLALRYRCFRIGSQQRWVASSLCSCLESSSKVFVEGLRRRRESLSHPLSSFLSLCYRCFHIGSQQRSLCSLLESLSKEGESLPSTLFCLPLLSSVRWRCRPLFRESDCSKHAQAIPSSATHLLIDLL